MEFKITQRRYPDSKWDYKAVSTIYKNKEIFFYTLSDKGKKSKAVEIFQGKNYDVNSNTRSYSRRYTLTNLPKEYQDIVKQLIAKHRITKWSNAKRVDNN